jgi:hypothetical protein
MEIPAEVQLAIEREVAKVRNEARQEAEKARNQAIGVLAFIALALSLASALGISQMIKDYSTSAAKKAVQKSTGNNFTIRAERAASDAEISSIKTRQSMEEAAKRLRDVKGSEDWSEPKLEQGWVAYTGTAPGTHNPPGYYKDAFDVVHIRGLIQGKGGKIFALPDGYKPKFRQVFIAEATDSPGRVDVLSNGDVILLLGNPTWVSLDSISFRVDRH